MDIGQNSQSKGTRRTWNKNEEESLLKILEEIVANGGKCENGTFRSGTMKAIEKKMQELHPDCGLKVNPHIDSKMRKWKKDYAIVYDMTNKSGFAWNDITKCIEVDSDEAWQAYIQHNTDAVGWRGKHFPIFDRLANIFGKERATGRGAETPADMATAVDREDENFNNINEDIMEGIDIDETSPMSAPNVSTNSSRTRKRKKNKVGDESDDNNMKLFREMFKESVEQIATVTERFVTANDDRSDISKELKAMGLSPKDHLDVFRAILDKPQHVASFRSLEPEIREMFVQELLTQIKGD